MNTWSGLAGLPGAALCILSSRGRSADTVDSDPTSVAVGSGGFVVEERGVTTAAREDSGSSEVSGATQELIGVSVDCDRDPIRLRVRQAEPGFCHHGSRSCWGDDGGVSRLARRLEDIGHVRPPQSNTAALLADPDLLVAKLIEEAGELAGADGAAEVVSATAVPYDVSRRLTWLARQLPTDPQQDRWVSPNPLVRGF